MVPFGQNLLGWYSMRLSRRVQRALLKMTGGPTIIATQVLEVPGSVMDLWFKPRLQQIGVAEISTKATQRFTFSSLAELGRLIDPACLSVVDGDQHTHKVLCTNERPAVLRFSIKLESITLKVWGIVTDAVGLPLREIATRRY